MKKILILLGLVLLAASCSVQSFPESATRQLIGEWELIRSSGGISGETHEHEGEKIVLEITKDSVKNLKDGSLTSSSKYSLEMGKTIRSSEEVPLLIYPDGHKQSFEFDSGHLILYDECYDCYQYEYVKL